ncbi:MAG: hypothetical protein JW862_15975 [Anaerolineales bacterium]|nr:hypothetical protein [Anaerolineales bacterium]
MSETNPQLLIAQMLVERLARLSADSIWARRASGLRASLDKSVQQAATDGRVEAPEKLAELIELGYQMLEKAAQEIPSPEEILAKSGKR